MIVEFFLMAFRSLRANKTRTALSMLGVIIGVFTVILVTGIGSSAQTMIENQFKNLSVDSLMVIEDGGKSKLSPDDIDYVLRSSSYFRAGIESLRGGSSVRFGEFSQPAAVFGISEGFFDFSNLSLAQGRNFTNNELETKPKKAIIGHNILEEIQKEYPGVDILGESFTLNKKKFQVIGILKKNGNSGPAISYDDSIFLPYETARVNVLGESGEIFIVFLVKNVAESTQAKESLIQTLREAHSLKEWNEDDFRIFDSGSLVSLFTGAARILTLLLLAVASIILLVSGIGIMNVMFVVVAERTKEIGIMKAIGAKESTILTQFLLESIQLSMGAGIIGILLANGVITGINFLVKIIGTSLENNTGNNPLEGFFIPLSWEWGITAFLFSVGVGIIFGLYPALKASRMDPVDALRSE